MGDRYLRFFGPILDALRELGGSAEPREVRRLVLSKVVLPEAELNQKYEKTGANVVANEIAFARDRLRRLGLIDNSTPGIWRLTERGASTTLDISSAREWNKQLPRRPRRGKGKPSPDLMEEGPEEVEADGGMADLLTVLQGLPPKGFELLCQKLLRECGFFDVHVTGRSGDGGIDGHGILRVNDLVNFRVLFQCKRYQGSVGSGTIRDFRGAMMGRTEKGIIITTGSFTRDAEDEAVRDGAPPIELVDGERLVEMMQRLGIGVRPRTVYEVDLEFFRAYSVS